MIITTKKMSPTIMFLKKIVFFYCLLLLSAFNSRLSSQVIYTDIPDITPNVGCSLDLNNDGIVDFVIQFGGSAGNIGVMCYPQNSNAYSGEFVGGVHLPRALSSSATICDTLVTWYGSDNPGTMALGTNTGYWLGATNKYLALKLIVGTNTYYGWARLDILSGSGSFTVKDYAYESRPNTCIQTGQSTSGISENTDKYIFSIFPNPFVSSVTIRTVGNLENATLTMYNSYGQTVKQLKNISGQTVSLSRDNFPSGLYFIRLTEANKTIAVEKLVIND
jgi:hypothetical protein